MTTERWPAILGNSGPNEIRELAHVMPGHEIMKVVWSQGRCSGLDICGLYSSNESSLYRSRFSLPLLSIKSQTTRVLGAP